MSGGRNAHCQAQLVPCANQTFRTVHTPTLPSCWPFSKNSPPLSLPLIPPHTECFAGSWTSPIQGKGAFRAWVHPPPFLDERVQFLLCFTRLQPVPLVWDALSKQKDLCLGPQLRSWLSTLLTIVLKTRWGTSAFDQDGVTGTRVTILSKTIKKPKHA